MEALIACFVVLTVAQTVGLTSIVLEIRRFRREFEVTTTLSLTEESSATPRAMKLALNFGEGEP